MSDAVGSLCTGIMGLDLAAHAVYGSDLGWYSELEPAACTVVERHTDAPNLSDLTKIDWRTVPPVDILTAGYPCQPFSHAGNRKGASDDRHLWPYIADAVRVLRPRRVVLENVAGHLSLGFDVVLGDLADAGFDAEWCVLRASDVGAPHQRARLFVVASNTDREGREGPIAAISPGRDGAAGCPARDSYGARADALATTGRSWDRLGEPDRASADATNLGHEWGGPARGRGDGPANSGAFPTDATGAERRGTQQQGMAEAVGRATEPGECAGAGANRGGATDWGQYEPAIRRWEHTLGRPAPRPTDDQGRLSPAFVEWMQGYPAGWVDGLSRTQALKALGNAVVPQQGEAAIRLLEAAHMREVAA